MSRAIVDVAVIIPDASPVLTLARVGREIVELVFERRLRGNARTGHGAARDHEQAVGHRRRAQRRM